MAPFGRESPTSYSTLMVLMTLSASVSKLQPSEICVTSVLTSPGQSRSKPIAPFVRASMTSYSTLMVTIALTASVSKLQQSLNNWWGGGGYVDRQRIDHVQVVVAVAYEWYV